jgi:hypothetical protein
MFVSSTREYLLFLVFSRRPWVRPTTAMRGMERYSVLLTSLYLSSPIFLWNISLISEHILVPQQVIKKSLVLISRCYGLQVVHLTSIHHNLAPPYNPRVSMPKSKTKVETTFICDKCNSFHSTCQELKQHSRSVHQTACKPSVKWLPRDLVVSRNNENLFDCLWPKCSVTHKDPKNFLKHLGRHTKHYQPKNDPSIDQQIKERLKERNYETGGLEDDTEGSELRDISAEPGKSKEYLVY